MKVIFLDIDGVLNTIETFKQIKDLYKETGKRKIEIDEFRIKYLREIVVETKAKIVLSSSWRIFFKKENNQILPNSSKGEELINILKKYELTIFDITPYDKNRYRQNEIEEYLSTHDISSFVVIDDDSYDLQKYVGKELIKTSFIKPNEIVTKIEDYQGLCQEHIPKAIEILNKKQLKLTKK